MVEKHGGVLDPDQAGDLAEFVGLLGELRAWAGLPSYRALAKRVGPLMRPPQVVPPSTVVGAFKSERRRLDLDLVVAIVRALGVDEADVGCWREAYLRIQRDMKSGGQAGVFRQLPADLATFTGRDEELKELTKAATAPIPEGRAATVVVSAIEGTAGVGKTQLALRVAHDLVRAGRYEDIQLYVNLRGFDEDLAPSDPAQVLSAFLRQLGVPPAMIPEPVDERAAMFRDQLHERRALVLLDNAANEEQVRPLIPSGPQNLVLITSRRHLPGLEGADLVVLDVFTPVEGVALLAKIVGADRVEAEPQAAREIVDLCGRLPLAVALAASRLGSRPAWGLGDLIRRLQDDRIAGLGDAGRSPWPVFELSYRGLSDAARRLFRLLALHPGRDMTAESSAALVGCDAAGSRAMLESLVDEHLLQQKSADRYEFHDLLRVYAQHRVALEVSDAERARACERVLRWYASTANAAALALDPAAYALALPVEQAHGLRMDFDGPAPATAWFRMELANLSAAVEQAHQQRFGFAASAWITAAMDRFLFGERRETELVALRRIGLAGARQTQDRRSEALALYHIAKAESQLGDHGAAQGACVEAIDIYRALGDLVGQARTMAVYAFTLLRTGRTEQAFDVAGQSVSMLRRTGDRSETAAALSSLAACLHALHRPDDALDLLMEARGLTEEANDPLRLALMLRNTGFTFLVLRQYQEAEEAFIKSSKTFCDAGDLFLHIESLHGLARAQYGQGRADLARQTIAEVDTKLAQLDGPTATRFRRGLESSPIRHDESVEVDPTATAWS